jgi:hypothetical protein
MTKAALEAAVNALLAPSQPITANGMHKPSMQQVINEMYDAQSRGDVLAAVAAVLSLSAGDQILIIRSGEAKLVARSAFAGASFRGDYAGGTSMPTTGGNYTAGAPAAGDEWRLTDVLTIGGNVYGAGTIIKAMINSPGDTVANWAFIQTT